MVISETGMLVYGVKYMLTRCLAGSGEKKGDLPCDKAPLKSVRNDRSGLAVTFFEALNTSSSINKFLFSCVERMAG